MSRTGEKLAILSFVIAVIACLGTWLALPQIQGLLDRKDVTDLPGSTLPIAQPSANKPYPDSTVLTAYLSSQPAQPASSPSASLAPEQLDDGRPSFGEVRFCLEGEIEPEVERECQVSRTTFTNVSKIHARWSYNNVYKGMIFSRRWKWEGQLLPQLSRDNVQWDGVTWKTDGHSECTFVDTTGREVFPERTTFRPGRYTFELYIGDRLEQVGRFEVTE